MVLLHTENPVAVGEDPPFPEESLISLAPYRMRVNGDGTFFADVGAECSQPTRLGLAGKLGRWRLAD